VPPSEDSLSCSSAHDVAIESRSSHVVHLGFEGSSREVGLYWLSPSSLLFVLAGAGFSFEVFQLSSRPTRVQAPVKDDLPCPWAPLQSITAAASHRSPYRRVQGPCAGQDTLPESPSPVIKDDTSMVLRSSMKPVTRTGFSRVGEAGAR